MYPEARGGFQLPTAGRYTVQAPDGFPSTTFSRSKAGALMVQVDPRIVAPTNEGFQIRFTKVSAKVFKRGGLPASQLGDYLKACGVSGSFASEQDLADAVEATANRTYEVDVDWEARSKDGFQVTGMSRFPSDGNGGHQSWVEHPTLKDPNGSPLRLRANLVVTRFVAA